MFTNGGKTLLLINLNASFWKDWKCQLQSLSKDVSIPVQIAGAGNNLAIITVPSIPKSKYFLSCNYINTTLESNGTLEVLEEKDFNVTLIGSGTILLGFDAVVLLRTSVVNLSFKKPKETECFIKKTSNPIITALKGSVIDEKINCKMDPKLLSPGRYHLWFSPNFCMKELILNSTNFVHLTISGPKPEIMEARLTDSLDGVLIKFSVNPTGDSLCRNVLMASTVAMLGSKHT